MNKIFWEKYSDKALIVRGDTQSHLENLKKIGGKFISKPLDGKGPGWIFSLKKEEDVDRYVRTGMIFEKSIKSKSKDSIKSKDSSKKINDSNINYCDIEKLQANAKADKWWENIEKKDYKWKTLRHNGVYFPPAYEPLPSNVKILYNGKPVDLDSRDTRNLFHVTAEEAAVFFATKMEQDDRLSAENSKREKSTEDKKFISNFWGDWKKILGKNHIIKDFSKVDFRNIQKYIRNRSEDKILSVDEKNKIKEEKNELKELYGYAIIDGVKIPIGNWMLQPPGLYSGHGKQPLKGRIKGRLVPEDITLNVSLSHVPNCKIYGKECTWGNVVEDHDVIWIASWEHPITGKPSYVYLKREASQYVCASDIQKFEKARKLGENIEKIRESYTKDLTNLKSDIRQLATAVYLLDILAIRPGTEKDETKEAGTVGLTTLKCENIQFKDNNNIKIEFIGKSSIEFSKKFEVSPVVYRNLKELCFKAKSSKEIFPDINSNSLNEYLKSLLPGLTAKVFRTYKASSILQKELDKKPLKPSMDIAEKKLVYDMVNIEVAKVLNHKKLGTSDKTEKKLKEKLKELKEKTKNAKTPKQKETIQKTISKTKAQLEEAEQNISTGTSKVNYLDPRIIVAWCKKGDMPIEKIYNKTQVEKFIWAMETGLDWRF